MITCKSGVTIRMTVADISEQGRATQGVKLIRLDEGDEIAAITQLDDHVTMMLPSKWLCSRTQQQVQKRIQERTQRIREKLHLQ